MLRSGRLFPVTCVAACLVLGSWSKAFASDDSARKTDVTRTRIATGFRPVSVFGEVPSELSLSLVPPLPPLAVQKRQSVATTNEPKLLLGIAAGALIVTGVAMITYGATSTCKGLHETTNSCDKKTVIGAMAVSGGAVMLVVWGLSRP